MSCYQSWPVLVKQTFNFLLAAAVVVSEDLNEQQTSTRPPSFKHVLGCRFRFFLWSRRRTGLVLFIVRYKSKMSGSSGVQCDGPTAYKEESVSSRCPHTALLIAASTEALGMFLLLHCSRMWARFTFSSGLGPPSAHENKIEISTSPQKLNSIKQHLNTPASPFTAIFIIMPNFMNILPLASSLGPLMCFTLDHLLWPAHNEEQRCSVRTEEGLHRRDITHAAGGRTDFTGAELLPDAAASARGIRVRRAPSPAAPAMPFSHTHSNNWFFILMDFVFQSPSAHEALISYTDHIKTDTWMKSPGVF